MLLASHTRTHEGIEVQVARVHTVTWMIRQVNSMNSRVNSLMNSSHLHSKHVHNMSITQDATNARCCRMLSGGVMTCQESVRGSYCSTMSL